MDPRKQVSMWGVDYKKRMEDILFDDLREYLPENRLERVFEMPILGYADANDPGFTDCYEADLTQHPKEIYRPGSTVIVSFLPYNKNYVSSNFKDPDGVSAEWTYAYEKSIMVSSHINGVIMRALEDMGREVSLTGLPGDWDTEKSRPEWSHKIAAYIAGMGEFGQSGSFRTIAGPLGRFNSVITELSMDYTGGSEGGNNVVAAFMESMDIVPDGDVKCPASAISESGTDMAKCRDFCGSLGQATPESDVCGKCFL